MDTKTWWGAGIWIIAMVALIAVIGKNANNLDTLANSAGKLLTTAGNI